MNNTERILYRGQEPFTGKWRFGFYNRANIKHAYTTEDRHFISIVNEGAYQVNPETVGQWTGLTDKAGNKVFASDLLRNKVNSLFVVLWKDDMAAFVGKFLSSGDKENYYYLNQEFIGECETVGSIHSNPELLKGGE